MHLMNIFFCKFKKITHLNLHQVHCFRGGVGGGGGGGGGGGERGYNLLVHYLLTFFQSFEQVPL